MVLAEIVLGFLSSSLSLFAAAAVTTADAATAAKATAAAAKKQLFHKVKSRWARPTGFILFNHLVKFFFANNFYT